MNAQFKTPGANKRTSDDNGRGPLWRALFVLFVLAVVIAAVLVLSY